MVFLVAGAAFEVVYQEKVSSYPKRMNRRRNNDVFVGNLRRIVCCIYHKRYNIVIFCVRFYFYFRNNRRVTKIFGRKHPIGIEIDRLACFCQCWFNHIYQRPSVAVNCTSFSDSERIKRNCTDSSIDTFAL